VLEERKIGVHLRVFGALTNVVMKAKRLDLSCLQCFFIEQSDGRVLRVDDDEVKAFREICASYNGTLYLHASYWINLADGARTKHPVLQKEIKLAKRLGFKNIVLHPGTTKGVETKEEGIAAVARCLNDIVQQEPDITFILENTAHAGMSIGGDINDFKYLRTLFNNPERIKFCIDTAHAYVFGYDITNEQERKDFFTLLDDSIGMENIVLLHLNDTKQACGSHMDEHAVIGQGLIGAQALKDFACHPKLKHVPIIMELPIIPEEEEAMFVQSVKQWDC